MTTTNVLNILLQLKLYFPTVQADEAEAMKWWGELFEDYEYIDAKQMVKTIRGTVDVLNARTNLYKLFKDNLDAITRKRKQLYMPSLPKVMHRVDIDGTPSQKAEFVYNARMKRATDPKGFYAIEPIAFHEFKDIETLCIQEVMHYFYDVNKTTESSFFKFQLETLPRFYIKNLYFDLVSDIILKRKKWDIKQFTFESMPVSVSEVPHLA